MAKNLLNKYVWLVETIYKARRITFEEINEKWLETDMSEGVEIARRTFHKWRIAVEEMFGLIIECERRGGYHYYIENDHEITKNNIRNWVLNTISAGNVMMNSLQLKDRILLEDIPAGQDFLQTVLTAMKNSHPLNICYQSYWKKEKDPFLVEPYCVKLFKQRWYLVGNSPEYEKIFIFALDRIIRMEIEEEKSFRIPVDFIPAVFFKDSFDIITTSDNVEKVCLKVSAEMAQSFRSHPLHYSQQEVSTSPDSSIFEFHLQPTFDFLQEIFSNFPDVEVIEPLWLRKKMNEKLQFSLPSNKLSQTVNR